MKRIAVIGDLHMSDNKPQYRIDNFHLTQMDKFSEIINIGKEKKVDLYLFTGDFFHIPEPSYALLDNIIDILSCNWPDSPIYSLIGNHDIFGYNYETLYRTGINNLIRNRHIKLLEQIVFELDHIVIKGIHVYSPKEYFIKEDKYKDYLKIIVAHDLITPEKCVFESTPIDNIRTNTDIIICGDYHHPFDIQRDKTHFINTGAIIRHKVNEDFEPSIVIITINERFVDPGEIPDVFTPDYSIETIKLKSAPKNPFEMSVIEEKKEFKNFIETLQSVKFTSLDLVNEIAKIGKLNNIENEIIKEIQRRIDGYRESKKIN